MTDAATRDARTAWVWGGWLLIAQAALILAGSTLGPGISTTVIGWISALVGGAALVLFAFGVRGSGSVVARRPLGVVAICVLAIWPILVGLVGAFVPFTMATLAAFQTWGNISLAVQVAAALVAVMQIVRIGVVPSPWGWAPLWALLVLAAPQLLLTVASAAAPANMRDIAGPVVGLGQLAAIAAPLGLGILALILANRPALRNESQTAVQIYPPTA